MAKWWDSPRIFAAILGALSVLISAFVLPFPWNATIGLLALVIIGLYFRASENQKSAEAKLRSEERARDDEFQANLLERVARLEPDNVARQAYNLAAEMRRYFARRDEEARAIRPTEIYALTKQQRAGIFRGRHAEQMKDTLKEYDDHFRQRVTDLVAALGGDMKIEKLAAFPGPTWPIGVRLISDRLAELAEHRVLG